MAKEIGRFILVYIICACLGALMNACKSTKSATDYQHAGSITTAQNDDGKATRNDVGLSSVIDTSDTEITWTRTTYDTERTDSDGTHPVKSVEQMHAKKREKKEKHDTNISNEETGTHHDSRVEVDESTEYKSTEETARPLSSPLKMALFVLGLVFSALIMWKFRRVLARLIKN